MTGTSNRREFLRGGLIALVGLGGAACAGPLPDRSARREPQFTEHYRVFTDVGYATPVGWAHLLDVYVPLEAASAVPVVIFQMGSAFENDDVKGTAVPDDAGIADTRARGMIDAPQLAVEWVPQGYAVVGLNVRSSSQANFPAQVHDVKAAIRFLRAHAADFGLDPDRFATMGNSSGGWVATMAALTSGVAELEGDLGYPEQSSAVSAVIDLFGPTDFLRMDAHRTPDGQVHDAADSPESVLMGFPIQSDPLAVEKVNPATYVRVDSPPAFITHGAADPLVPANQSEILFEAYAGAGATATLVQLPGVGHTDAHLFDRDYSPGRVVQHTTGGITTSGTEPAPTFDALRDFLATHLGS